MSSNCKKLIDLSLLMKLYDTPEKLFQSSTIVISRDAVSHADLEEHLRSIQRRFSFPLKAKTLDLYTNNRIFIIYNKETIKMPMFLPCWRMIQGNTVISYANITNYVVNTIENVDTRKIYTLMQYSACLILGFVNFEKFANSIKFLQSGANIYSRMMFKIFDKMANIGLDPTRSQQVKYFFAKYFCINMAKRAPNETTDNIALKAAEVEQNKASITDFEEKIFKKSGKTTQLEMYSIDFLSMITLINNVEPWAEVISSRAVMQNFLMMYGAGAYLAAEDLTYFVAAIASYTVGSDIVNTYSFDRVVGTSDGDNLIDEFTRLCTSV